MAIYSSAFTVMQCTSLAPFLVLSQWIRLCIIGLNVKHECVKKKKNGLLTKGQGQESKEL